MKMKLTEKTYKILGIIIVAILMQLPIQYLCVLWQLEGIIWLLVTGALSAIVGIIAAIFVCLVIRFYEKQYVDL